MKTLALPRLNTATTLFTVAVLFFAGLALAASVKVAEGLYASEHALTHHPEGKLVIDRCTPRDALERGTLIAERNPRGWLIYC